MRHDKFSHGLSEDTWNDAKKEVRQAMISVAQNGKLISYSDLVSKVQSCCLDPHGSRLAHMLCEISSEEEQEERGLLTVVVVHKTGDKMPGDGFFELAQSLGRDTTDKVKFWIDELQAVYKIWSK